MIYVIGVQGCPKGEASKFKPNKNGVWPVILKSVNGVPLPQNSDILDGSVAASMGVEVGNTYMLMIVEKDPYIHTDGKIYKKYDYTVVGGNASQQIATEMAKAVIVDISAMIARPSTSTSASASTSAPVLTQPVINADEPEEEDDDLSDEDLDAEIKRLQAVAKAKKAAAKKAAEAAAKAEAAPDGDVPF
jgi:hypothetical protein